MQNKIDLSGEKYIYSGDVNANFTDDMIALTMMNTNSYPILTPSDFGIDDRYSGLYNDFGLAHSNH